jgi:hypothetical protein
MLSLLRFRAFVLSVFRDPFFKRLSSCSAERNKKGETGSCLISTLLRFHWSNGSDFSPPFHESKSIRSRGPNPVIFLFFARIGPEVVVA